MKKNLYLLVACLCLCAFQNNVYAQAMLHTTITSVSDANPKIGDEILVNILIKNESTTTTFNDVINFDLANNNGVINNVNIVGKPNYNGTAITLAPLESKTGLFTVKIEGPYFVVGPDIIIVWPIATADILDSARAVINVQAALGINDEENDNLQYWQNNDDLFIQGGNAENSLESVRIYSINGQLVVNQTLQPGNNAISIINLAKGIYVAEVKLQNGELRRLKWAKQ